MTELTVGEVARLSRTSEKAIRLYSDRGLLRPRRDHANARRYAGTEVDRARLIVLLRALDMSLDEVTTILDATDPTAAFDQCWSRRRRAAQSEGEAAEYLRSALNNTPIDLAAPTLHEVQSRLVVCATTTATLSELSAAIPALTERVFAYLTQEDVPLAGPVAVHYLERVTDDFPACIELRVPVHGPVDPTENISVKYEPDHREAAVSLSRSQARSQSYLVAVHDFLSSGRFLPGGITAGNNREYYFESFGCGDDDDIVMKIAVPVAEAIR